MVAGTTVLPGPIRTKVVFGSNDAGSMASLNTTWTALLSGTFVWPLVGFVDTTVGATRSVPVPVVNDCDGKLDCALPVMSTTPVTLIVYTVPFASGTSGSSWMPLLPSHSESGVGATDTA